MVISLLFKDINAIVGFSGSFSAISLIIVIPIIVYEVYSNEKTKLMSVFNYALLIIAVISAVLGVYISFIDMITWF